MREKYSPHFATILTEMLTKGQNMRPGIEKVYEMIKPSLQSLDSSFKCSGRDTLSKKILKKGYNCVENHELYQAKHASQAAIDSWNSLLARIKNTAT